MISIIRNKYLCILLVIFPSVSLFSQDPDITHNQIDTEIQIMAENFLKLRPMQGFNYKKMSISRAYFWQGRMADYLGIEFGPVIGYKTGGHNTGSSFATFPKDGIRGLLLENMLKPNNFKVKLEATKRGFLEADFAFRVKDASINEANTEIQLLAGIDAIIPFAEIPDPYYEPDTRSVNGTIVSNMGSRFSVMGIPLFVEPTEFWIKKINNFTFAVHDEHNNLIEEGEISGWYKPLEVVKWLRDHLLSNGIRLKTGDILSLGNIGIIKQLHPDSPRGPAYKSNSFTLSYYGLSEQPVSVTIMIDRS